MTSRQVYYRKWRPSRFSDLAGQEHVGNTLRQAIMQGRVSHSFLFCGPRGTGKTTTARILAKAVNCLSPQEGDPCNQCSICRSVNEGRFMDIIELDAASNRGIDEIRDIRDKVNFAPVEGKRKVYIIDEAHMLTDQASNAFLKTLEEPPGHVIFVLCTTEAHKILATIVSRCQRYDFRRLPAEVVFSRLSYIAQEEGVTVAPDALRLVARQAGGSLRDAQNLLEQLVVSYGNGVTLVQVEELLGLGHGERWLELAKRLALGDTTACLAVINQAAWEGTDLRQLHRQTLDLLRALMLLRWDADASLDLPDHVVAQLRELAVNCPPWRIVRAVKIWGDVNMRYDAPSTLPLELATVEICNDDVTPPRPAAEAPLAPPRASAPPPQRNIAPPSQPSRPPAAPPPSASRPPAASPPQSERPAGAAPPISRPSAAASLPPSARPPQSAPAPAMASSGGDALSPNADFLQRWQAAVKALGRYKGKKYNLGALLRDCRSDGVTLDGGALTLPFSHRANLERMQEELDDPRGRQILNETIAKFMGEACQLKLTLVGENGGTAPGNGGNGNGGMAPRSPQQQHSPLVRAALGMGARILEEIPE